MLGFSVFHKSPARLTSLFNLETRAIAVVTLISCVLSVMILGANGDLFGASGLLIGGTALLLSLYRLNWGFNILIASVLSFDQVVFAPSSSITSKVRYFWNVKDIPYLPSIDIAYLSVFEMHFLLLVFIWLSAMIIKRNMEVRRVQLWFPALLFFLWILVSFLRGLTTGGTLLPALWESRALVYLGLFYFFVPQIIQTREDLESLMWTIIGAVFFKALQGVLNAITYGFDLSAEAYLTASQEDPVFIVTIILFWFALIAFGVTSNQRRALSWLILPLFLGFFAGNRRAAYVSLGISILAFITLLSGKKQRTVMLTVASVLLLFGVYLAIFWNNYGRLGQPAQQVKSVIVNDPTLISATKYNSNLYRQFESYNLAYTIQHSPILGLGFGKPYETPIHLFLRFGLSEYIAHNSLLWLFMRTGALGFGLFLLFVNMYLFRSTSVFTRLTDPYLKAVCAVCILAVVNQVVVTYVEMHFTYYRTMTYLGVLMGLLPAIEGLHESTKHKQPSATPGFNQQAD